MPTDKIPSECRHASRAAPLPRLDHCRVLVLFGGAELFGQERANLEVFRKMAEFGLKARFITSSKWGRQQIQPELDRLGFEWATAPFGYHWTKHMLGRHFGYFLRNLYGVVATSRRLWREARRWKPTHLYLMNWIYFLYAAPTLLASRRLPLIYRAGDLLPVQTAFHRWLCQHLFRRLTMLVCNSNYLEQRLQTIAAPALEMKVIYNHPPVRTPAADPHVRVPPGATVIVYVGQIVEGKGVHLLVEAIKSLIKRGCNLALLLAGDSSWGDALGSLLQTEVRAEKLEERIQFLGYVENVPGLLRQAHIHTCPSLWQEGSPNVVLEAKSEGLPSVVFASGGIPELVEHGLDGYICRDTTAEALAEGIAYFATNPERRQRAGEAARRSLREKFGEDRFCRAWAEVFLATAPQKKVE